MEFELQCDCGRCVPIAASQAGSQTNCECGNVISIPRLGELRRMVGLRAVEMDDNSAANWQQPVQSNNPYAAPGSVVATGTTTSENVLLKLLWIDGRASRSEYWGILLLCYVLNGALSLIKVEGGAALLVLALIAMVCWVITAMRIRRWHDLGKSGAWWFIKFVPCIGVWWEIIEQGFVEGTIGENEHGPDSVLRQRDTTWH